MTHVLKVKHVNTPKVSNSLVNPSEISLFYIFLLVYIHLLLPAVWHSCLAWICSTIRYIHVYVHRLPKEIWFFTHIFQHHTFKFCHALTLPFVFQIHLGNTETDCLVVQSLAFKPATWLPFHCLQYLQMIMGTKYDLYKLLYIFQSDSFQDRQHSQVWSKQADKYWPPAGGLPSLIPVQFRLISISGKSQPHACNLRKGPSVLTVLIKCEILKNSVKQSKKCIPLGLFIAIWWLKTH